MERWNTALYGRHPSRTRVSVATVAVITVVAYVLGRFVGGPALVTASVAHLPVLVGGVFVLGGVAASIAYWNDSLLVGLSAVFGPTALASVGLAVVGFGVLWIADLLPGTSVRAFGDGFFVVSAVSQGPVVGTAVVAFWVGIAALAAYRGGGLLGSWGCYSAHWRVETAICSSGPV